MAASATPAGGRVTRGNWLAAPFNRLAFQRVDTILPVAAISRGLGPERKLKNAPDEETIDRIVYEVGTSRSTIGDFLQRSSTDGLIVLRGESVVAERYMNDLTSSTCHSLMSISKSLAGMVAGRLIDREVFDPDAEVAAIIPELKRTAYGDATAQQVLDTAVAVRFNQEYDNSRSDVQTEDRASGWRPRLPGDPPDTKAFLATIQGEGGHGTRLQYCSATTDVLAWMMERASGRPYAELLGEELWSQIGAEHDAYVTVDDSGFPYACAGVCATLRDVARFGRLVLDGGVWNGRTVLPKSWIDSTRHGAGSPVTSAPDFEAVWGAYPDAVYHNQWWTTRGPHGAFFGLGIFGQYLWLDPQSDVVIVKLSSLPAPNTPEDNKEHMTALDALASALAE